MEMVFDSFLIEFFGSPFLNDDSAHRALSQASAKSIAIYLADQPCLAIDNLQRAFRTSGHTGATAITLLFIYPDDFSYGFNGHFCTTSAGFLSDTGLSSPIICFQRSSPRHCLAEAHHSMQEGSLSLKTTVPHF
jgi:hypothetical protein